MDDNEKFQLFESRLSERPNSPLFARLAEMLRERGETARAIELCEKGMESYPEYTTGFFVAAQCYYAAGKTSEAENALRHILKHHTRHSTALKFLEDIKSARDSGALIEAEHAKAFELNSKRLLEELAGTENTLTLNEFLAVEPESSGSIEALATSLKGAKIQPAPEPPAVERRSMPPEPKTAPNPVIPTATLAEIYERQGQYSEAIAVLEKMIELNPAERGRYEQRIEMLRQLLESRSFGL